MFSLNKLFRNFAKVSLQPSFLDPKLNFEHLESRRMLAATADIVFLVDETGPDEDTQGWLKDELIPWLEDSGYSESFVNKQITEVRYGLVGFGDSDGPGSTGKEAKSLTTTEMIHQGRIVEIGFLEMGQSIFRTSAIYQTERLSIFSRVV